MQHFMLDAYRADGDKLNELRRLYETIYKTINSLGAKAIMPPILVPYYYGEVKEDDGISAFVLLKGGHFTIHTFPERECYFVDMLYDGYIAYDKLTATLDSELPFAIKKTYSVDRRFDISSQRPNISIDESKDFGPHYLIRIIDDKEFSHQEIYQFLDNLPKKINMEPIMRPLVITDKVQDYNIISGITMIAQSHIAFHHYIQSKQTYLDIFSCSFIDSEDIIITVQNMLGAKCQVDLISRGSKHETILTKRAEFSSRYNAWKDNIE